MKTVKELAREALAVQDACNLSGVAIAFARVMVDLREALESQNERADTSSLRFHPITTVWVDKLASLADVQHLGSERVSTAFQETEKLAQ